MLGRGAGGAGAAGGGMGAAGGLGVLGRGIGGLGFIAGTSYAVPQLRKLAAKHGVKPGSAIDKTGTILGYTGGYAAGGALLGSMIAPGVGTAIGAGVGALAGAGMGIYQAQKQQPIGGDNYSPTTWAQQLLREMSIAPKNDMTKAIANWEAHEGGHWNNTARYNPLNTTQRMLSSDTNMNSSGVKVYSSWDEGLRATVKTLMSKGHGYEKIIHEMDSGTPDDFYQAVVDSKWGTQSLMGHVRGKGSHKKTGKHHVNTGVYTPPANGPKTARFGQKPPKGAHYWTQYGYHTGQDYGVPVGTSVKAYKSGVVEHAGSGSGASGLGGAWGNVILVNHGDHKSMYAHLSNVGVKKGQKVRAGQQIGLSGNTGSASQGPHLHFEIRKGRKPVDPMPYLGGGSGGSLIPAPSAAPSPAAVLKHYKERVKDGFGGFKDVAVGAVDALNDPKVRAGAKVVGNKLKDLLSGGSSSSSGNDSTGTTTTSSKSFTSVAAAAGQISVSNLGISSSYGSVNNVLGGNSTFSNRAMQADYSGFSNAFGGDANPPSVGSFDPVGTSLRTRGSSISHSDHGITINMNISIANANSTEAVNMAKQIKTILERELRDSKIRNY